MFVIIILLQIIHELSHHNCQSEQEWMYYWSVIPPLESFGILRAKMFMTMPFCLRITH